MSIAEALLPELDHEMTTTRSLLERVPGDRADWKPHAKSMSMGQLAIHLPGLLLWIPRIVGETELDVTAPGSRTLNPAWESTTTTLATFDRVLADGRATVAGASDATLREPWTLKAGTHVIFTLPRVAALRTMVMNHMIHHRGQLSVYLRLNDVPLPEIYGPTADSIR